jgi:hypothetical protein
MCFTKHIGIRLGLLQWQIGWCRVRRAVELLVRWLVLGSGLSCDILMQIDVQRIIYPVRDLSDILFII